MPFLFVIFLSTTNALTIGKAIVAIKQSENKEKKRLAKLAYKALGVSYET